MGMGGGQKDDARMILANTSQGTGTNSVFLDGIALAPGVSEITWKGSHVIYCQQSGISNAVELASGDTLVADPLRYEVLHGPGPEAAFVCGLGLMVGTVGFLAFARSMARRLLGSNTGKMEI